ncbi:MAG: hypothetical protein VX733_06915 [Candidatus Latescibacterota bacterium]|nr:hypothetical protein [Candidatus Latescibacterota bacterium]
MILIVGALAMAVRSLLFFARESSQMGSRLQKLERDLGILRDGISEKKGIVTELTSIVDPLKAKERRLRTYYEDLKALEMHHERASAEAEEIQRLEKEKRMKRKNDLRLSYPGAGSLSKLKKSLDEEEAQKQEEQKRIQRKKMGFD